MVRKNRTFAEEKNIFFHDTDKQFTCKYDITAERIEFTAIIYMKDESKRNKLQPESNNSNRKITQQNPGTDEYQEEHWERAVRGGHDHAGEWDLSPPPFLH